MLYQIVDKNRECYLCIRMEVGQLYVFHDEGVNRLWSSSTILLLGTRISSLVVVSLNLTIPSFCSRSPTSIIQGILDSSARSKCFVGLLLTMYSAFSLAFHNSLTSSAAWERSLPKILTRTWVSVARIACQHHEKENETVQLCS